MHDFKGKWITDEEFYQLAPRNVFHKQLQPMNIPCDSHRDRHILFRKKFFINEKIENSEIFITADDYYKLYINGSFVAQGPAPSYHFQYNYNRLDVKKYLKEGENTIAVHTLYQGLINRVWQSADQRHGMILDLEVNGKNVAASDESFKTHPHTAYRETGIAGYQTQFLEEYDSNAREVGFAEPDFDDNYWSMAKIHQFDDHTFTEQKSGMLLFERISPASIKVNGNVRTVDFGSNYVGYLSLRVSGQKGERVMLRCGQELNADGTVRYALRANCTYEEEWVLCENESVLDQFDYKSFRFAEITLPQNCEILDICFIARHYPFELNARLKEEFVDNEDLKRIWELCVHTQKYGVQEVIQDCMEREKGFYVGDGCYTALTNLLLTKDDSMVRKLINDAFSSSFITEGLVTCINCSHMQEIAEYPLMLIYLVLWHYRIMGDREYLAECYPKIVAVLESFRNDYEKNGLLCELDRWCVVEWPKNFQDGYDVEIAEGKVCHEAHISINAYYIEAVKTANAIAEIIGEEPYRDTEYLVKAFTEAFYDEQTQLFKDGVNTEHKSIVGNIFPYAFDLCPDKESREKILAWLIERGITSLSFFCTFPAFIGLIRDGKQELIKEFLLDKKAWLNMLAEDATTTFEGWSADSKWNTSLFHLTFSYAAAFMTDTDLEMIFK